MIRHAQLSDVPEIVRLFEAARGIMHQNGNYSQWNAAYPGETEALKDIQNGTNYVMEDPGIAGKLYGVFTLIRDPEPTYTIIREVHWLDTTPYGTIHRIASDGTHQGVFQELMTFCKSEWRHLRIDTHQDNAIMLHLIQKEGFTYCGIIKVGDGTDRLAFEWVKESAV